MGLEIEQVRDRKVSTDHTKYYTFPKKSPDPLAKMPIEPLLILPGEVETSGWSTEHLVVADAEHQAKASERAALAAESGDGIRYANNTLAANFGSEHSHDYNTRLGELLHEARVEIFDYAKEHDIDLHGIKQGQPLDPKHETLRRLLVDHHELAQELAMGNWSLVPFTFKEVSGTEHFTQEEIENAYQDGLEGLLYAAKRWYPWLNGGPLGNNSESYAFSTYAVECIAGYMKRGRGEKNTVRVPEHAIRLAKMTDEMRSLFTGWSIERQEPTHSQLFALVSLKRKKLADKDKADPTPQELEDYLASIQKVRWRDDTRTQAQRDEATNTREHIQRTERIVTDARRALGTRSVDGKQTVTGRDPSTGEVDTGEETPWDLMGEGIPSDFNTEDIVDRIALGELIKKQLESLTPRQKEVLEMRFGLKDGQDHTLKEVGRYFGVTPEAIRQIEAKALKDLRHPRKSRVLRDFIDF